MPYYLRLADNKDLTLTPHVYTKALPAIEARFRHLTSLGAYQVGGFLTYGKIDSIDQVNATGSQSSRRGIRAYFEANGRFQFEPRMEHDLVAPRSRPTRPSPAATT